MSAFTSAGFFNSINTKGKPLMNKIMSGLRVWRGPLMVNCCTANHSLAAMLCQSIKRTKSPRVSPFFWYCTGTPATNTR